MLNVLTTKVRENSVSGLIAGLLKEKGYNVSSLPHNRDIRAAHIWAANEIPAHTDVLINTVGITGNWPVGKADLKKVDEIITTNLTGAIMLTEAFINTIGMQRPRLIIHVGSAGSRKVFTNCSAYCASKAGLAHYVECAGYELREKGIYVVGVHPDNISGTPMTQRVQRDLIGNRGMSEKQVSDIYSRAIPGMGVATFVVGLVEQLNNWPWITGENFYLGAGCKRGG